MKSPAPVAFHNVAELEPAYTGVSGVFLRRFTRPVRFDPDLSHIGRHFTAHSSNGCEIRFFASRPITRVYLSTTYDKARVFVLRGEYTYKEGYVDLEGGKVTTLHLEHNGFASTAAEAFAGSRFSPDMWRIYCLDAPIIFCGIEPGDGEARPPRPDELPRKRWLAYGSSITQAGSLYANYVNAAAQLLGADACNLGMGGSCHIEPSVADFIASRTDWDFATLELGINVASIFAPEEFERRARHMVRRIRESHPDKPLILLGVFTNGSDFTKEPDNEFSSRLRRFREIQAEIVAETRDPNLRMIDGRSVFADLAGFQTDLVHPGPIAYVRAGAVLAAALGPIVARPQPDAGPAKTAAT